MSLCLLSLRIGSAERTAVEIPEASRGRNGLRDNLPSKWALDDPGMLQPWGEVQHLPHIACISIVAPCEEEAPLKSSGPSSASPYSKQ